MKGYLGEKIIELKVSEYKNYTPIDWAKLWMEKYSQNDGSHHKAWCIDQVQRILFGTKVILKIASWDNGHNEEHFILDKPSKGYLKFIKDYEEDGEYSWDKGIP